MSNKYSKTIDLYIGKWKGLQTCAIKPRKEVMRMKVRYIGTTGIVDDDLEDRKYDIYASNDNDEVYAIKCD